jgi:hypothetical protein
MDEKIRKVQSDEAARVATLALFNSAEGYRNAAVHLNLANLKGAHKESPVRFLYYCAIEQYLKSFLYGQFVAPAELRNTNYRRNVSVLANEAQALGLSVDDEDKKILMSLTTALLPARYIKTGYHNSASIDALERISNNLRIKVGEALGSFGV